MQSHWSGPRLCLGFQPDLTPSLLVCVGLSLGVGQVSTTAMLTGLWLDSLSANPLGLSVPPLFIVGWMMFTFRELIVQDDLAAQFYLGATAGAATPLLQLWLLWVMGADPLIGWSMGIWWIVNAACCGVAVPLFATLGGLLDRWLLHSAHDPNRWPNENRQIVRSKH